MRDELIQSIDYHIQQLKLLREKCLNIDTKEKLTDAWAFWEDLDCSLSSTEDHLQEIADENGWSED